MELCIPNPETLSLSLSAYKVSNHLVKPLAETRQNAAEIQVLGVASIHFWGWME